MSSERPMHIEQVVRCSSCGERVPLAHTRGGLCRWCFGQRWRARRVSRLEALRSLVSHQQVGAADCDTSLGPS